MADDEADDGMNLFGNDIPKRDRKLDMNFLPFRMQCFVLERPRSLAHKPLAFRLKKDSGSISRNVKKTRIRDNETSNRNTGKKKSTERQKESVQANRKRKRSKEMITR